jgi:hypothetical protein
MPCNLLAHELRYTATVVLCEANSWPTLIIKLSENGNMSQVNELEIKKQHSTAPYVRYFFHNRISSCLENDIKKMVYKHCSTQGIFNHVNERSCLSFFFC